MTDYALFADVTARTLRGLLLPFGELSRPSISGAEPVMFSAGTVEIPQDISVLGVHNGPPDNPHSQLYPIARFQKIEETPAGLVAHFSIGQGAEGDQLLAAATDPDPAKRPRLSAEVRGLVRDGTRAIKAILTGAAFTPMGAFASAALFALAPDEATQITTAVTEAVTAALAPLIETPADTPPAETTNQNGAFSIMTQPGTAAVPPGFTPPGTVAPSRTADGLFSALAHARDNGEVLAQYANLGAMFAISTIQHSGPSTVTIGADAQVPQALNELWTRRPYERRYVPLFLQAALTSMKAFGWKWDPAKEPAVAAYSGNTAEIPSGAVDTIPVEVAAERIAGGHKLDRRYLDFGDSGIYDSYFRKMTESYARVSDANVLAAAVAGATVVAPGTVPSGIAAGLAAVVDGALAVIASENAPAFAVVSPELWRDIALTARNDVLGYLSASMGLESGSLDGFRIIPGAVGTGKVLVGAKEAMTVFELPGVPIRVEGLDPHHGAVDPALFGYLAKIINNALALALVDTAAE